MKKEIPPHHGRNLSKTKIISGRLADAPKRTARMVAASRAKKPVADSYGPAPVPDSDDWESVRAAAKTCRACPLWKNATCVVFGEGPAKAKVLVVGEQPGDQEDLAGRPFIGPAGKLFDRALEAAGVDRSKVYVTNAVKHFKWEPRGKRRLHQKPNAREMAACRPWLEKEIELLRPKLIVCLGATAANSVIGSGIKVTKERGRTHPTGFDIPALVTVHPSSLLRQPDRSKADDDFAAFVADLKKIKHLIAK
jgi:uracil-DNA glycosylase